MESDVLVPPDPPDPLDSTHALVIEPRQGLASPNTPKSAFAQKSRSKMSQIMQEEVPPVPVEKRTKSVMFVEKSNSELSQIMRDEIEASPSEKRTKSIVFAKSTSDMSQRGSKSVAFAQSESEVSQITRDESDQSSFGTRTNSVVFTHKSKSMLSQIMQEEVEEGLSEAEEKRIAFSQKSKSRMSQTMLDEVYEGPFEEGPIPVLTYERTRSKRLSAISGTPKLVKQMKRRVFNIFGKSEDPQLKLANTFNVYLESEKEERGDSYPCENAIFNPNRRFCRVWHICTAVVVMYIVAIVSFDLGFSWWRISKGLYIFNYFVDAYCWIDIALTFRTGYVHGGHLVMDQKRIAMHYLEFWFWVDLLASIPWEIFFSASKSNRKAVKFFKWFKLPRLLRLGRLRKLMKANARHFNLLLVLACVFICAHLAACTWVFIVDPCAAMADIPPFDEWQFSSDVEDNLVIQHPRLGWECTQGNIFYIYVQAAHTSVSMILGVNKATFGGYISGGGEATSLHEEISRYSKYLTIGPIDASADPVALNMRALKLILLQLRYPLSFADSMLADATLSSEGNCTNPFLIDMKPETNTSGLKFSSWMNIFGTLTFLLGWYFQGLLFANMTKLVIFRHSSENNFRQAHDEALRELDHFGHLIPQKLQERIRKYFQFRWINQSYGPLQLLKPDLLSRSLRAEIALHMYKDCFENVDFLSSAPIEVLQAVCLNLEQQYFMQGDAIYRRGEVPLGFFIVELGKVWVTSMDTFECACVSVEIDEVHPGEPFGIGAVLAVIQSKGNARVVNRKNAFASTVCNTVWLPLNALQRVCHEFPHFFEELLHVVYAGMETRIEPSLADLRHAKSCSFSQASKTSTIHSNGSLSVSRLRIASEAFQHEADCKSLDERLCLLEAQVKSNAQKVDDATNILKELVRITTLRIVNDSLADQTHPYSGLGADARAAMWDEEGC